MRSIPIYIIIALLFNLLANNVYSQQDNIPVLKFKVSGDNYVYYDSPVLKTLKFTVENLTSANKFKWQEIVNNSNLVKEIIFTSAEGAIQNGEFIFKKETDVLTFRSFLEELKIEFFYVNDNKVLTKTIIPISEAHDKTLNYVSRDYGFSADCNDTAKIDYYDFQIYYAQAKLQLMWGGNYPNSLFKGYVAKFTEILETTIVKRDLFLKKSNLK